MAQNQGIPVVGPMLTKIFGSRNERFVKKYTSRVDAINALEPEIRKLTDAQIREKIVDFQRRHDNGESTEALMPEAFAVAREAMDRAVGIRNTLNPEYSFDASILSERGRAMHAELLEKAQSTEPAPPEGDFLGSTEPVPAWVWIEVPPEYYEHVREALPESRPPFRARPFDVQLIGASVLSGGKISEMKTGEGKTIVAPLACYLACIERMKVHLVTVNDYLVQRDRDWTFPFYYALGMTAGAIHPMHMQSEDIKRQMYRCDVVFGTTSEFGFDYLRDNMKRSAEHQVQRRRDFAIVDEVDSILIDEARTPLIISGPAHEDKPRYDLADGLARHLVDKQKPWNDAEAKVVACKERIKGYEGDIRQARDKSDVPELQKKLEEARAELPKLEQERDQHPQFYELQLDKKQCHLTHEGISEAQRVAQVGSFYVDENMDLPHLLEQSLRAYAVYQRDKDYVIMDLPNQQTGRTEPSVVIVDVFTGRPMIGRQWSDGLHQAVEAKESVPIKDETQTVASITVQNFFKMYRRLAGMTGTADTEAQEFHDIYSLDVVSIPTNKEVVRDDYPDLVFLRAKDKWEAIVDEIKAFHDAGRPILVGTTSVEKSEMLSQMLTKKHGIQHNVLNAKQHEKEAQIIENAGQLGAVMIATNMAGRGTDIKLGRVSREQLIEHWLKRSVCGRGITPEATVEQLRENAYRKLASQELGLKKREIEETPFEEIEIRLLRHWAYRHSMLSERNIESMDADAIRDALDQTGRILLHRIRWFDTVEDIGGLHVIGTERHESRRIDNQLRGRSGRQGDQGSSRFYVSLEDELMKLFGGESMMKVLSRMGLKEGDSIESKMLSKRIEGAQRKVEERNFQIRKNILEYDEVMEHQRQRFYGLRQRVLEGRDVKGLIFDYIEEAVDNACGEYLDPEYPARCAGEHAGNVLDCAIAHERLKGKDLMEMETAIRRQAKEEARTMIDVTLGEYIPMEGSEVSVDFDSAGLIRWAKSRFGVDIDAAELREGGAEERRHVQTMLVEAAEQRIDTADLSGIAEYIEPDYGPKRLAEWTERKFGVSIDIEEIKRHLDDEERPPREILLDKARELYREREVEYPVEFAMDMTMALMRQSPQQASEQLATWANRRFNLGWTAESITTKSPQHIRSELLQASEKFVNDGRLDREIDEALSCTDDDALDAHLRERFGVGVTDHMRYLEGEEREHAVRARVESILRAELLYFERTVLLDIFDSSWKDHLYAMDQLRDGISFRAFSQQDPRIAFKREGARLFLEMFDGMRDRLTDYIFKARLSPTAQPQRQAAQPRPAPQATPQARPAPSTGAAGAANIVGSSISGPGLEPAASSGTPQRPDQAAQEPETNEPKEEESPETARAQVEAAQAAKAADRKKQRRR